MPDSRAHIGSVTALTTLSPVLPKKRRRLGRRLFFVRYGPGLSRPLLELSFIHYGRWTVLDRLPAEDGRGRGQRRLGWRYLLFESNYDGAEGDYLDTFAQVLPLRLAALFGTCFGFKENVEDAPGAAGRVLAPWAFRKFVERNKLEVLDFYAAYPHASVLTVRRAFAVAHSQGRADAMALGPPTGALGIKEAIFDPWIRAISGRYGVNPLAVAAPLCDGACDSLRELRREGPLLGEVPGAHFARLVLIPAELMDLGQPGPDRLDVPYLLFTSNYYGSLEDQLQAIRTEMGARADLIWSHCRGYPTYGFRDERAFTRWFKKHSLKTRYYVAGYPPHEIDYTKQRLEELSALTERRLGNAEWNATEGDARASHA